MISNANEPIYKRYDGTFIIFVNGLPYHVLRDDPYYDDVLKWIELGNIAQPEPIPPPPSSEQLAAQRRQAILAEITALDAKTIRPLRAGELDRVAEIEAQVVALRTELAAL